LQGTGWTFTCTTGSGNALSPVVSGPDHVFSIVLESSTAVSVASATVAGSASGVTAVLDDNGGGADTRLTVTRTVTEAAFVEGATINWNLLLRTTTTCLSAGLGRRCSKCPSTY